MSHKANAAAVLALTVWICIYSSHAKAQDPPPPSAVGDGMLFEFRGTKEMIAEVINQYHEEYVSSTIKKLCTPPPSKADYTQFEFACKDFGLAWELARKLTLSVRSDFLAAYEAKPQSGKNLLSMQAIILTPCYLRKCKSGDLAPCQYYPAGTQLYCWHKTLFPTFGHDCPQ